MRPSHLALASMLTACALSSGGCTGTITDGDPGGPGSGNGNGPSEPPGQPASAPTSFECDADRKHAVLVAPPPQIERRTPRFARCAT